jgi:hypothetical protein
MSGYQPNHLASVFFKSMMFLCNNCQPMLFFWYVPTIGWLADTVVTFLVSATADTVLLFCPTSTAHKSIYRRCTHDLRVLPIGRSMPILVVFHIGYGRSILSFPPPYPHASISRFIDWEVGFILIGHIPSTTLPSAVRHSIVVLT